MFLIQGIGRVDRTNGTTHAERYVDSGGCQKRDGKGTACVKREASARGDAREGMGISLGEGGCTVCEVGNAPAREGTSRVLFRLT